MIHLTCNGLGWVVQGSRFEILRFYLFDMSEKNILNLKADQRILRNSEPGTFEPWTWFVTIDYKKYALFR